MDIDRTLLQGLLRLGEVQLGEGQVRRHGGHSGALGSVETSSRDLVEVKGTGAGNGSGQHDPIHLPPSNPIPRVTQILAWRHRNLLCFVSKHRRQWKSLPAPSEINVTSADGVHQDHSQAGAPHAMLRDHTVDATNGSVRLFRNGGHVTQSFRCPRPTLQEGVVARPCSL